MVLQARLNSLAQVAATHLTVKICGITRPEDALFAARCGADMVGMVFAASRRRIDPEAARVVRDALAFVGSRALTVGVFVNEAPERVREIADYVGLDMVQLSGDESLEEVAECARFRPVIKALRFPGGTTLEEASRVVEGYRAAVPGDRLTLLVDAYGPDAYGGTGRAADRALACALAAQEVVILAGGLSPQNVAEVVSEVSPYGVDVSSGVERDGVKDRALIEAFVHEARRASALAGSGGL